MIWLALLASLGAGWLGSTVLAQGGRDRALWTAPLGGGLALSCALLLSAAPSGIAALATLLGPLVALPAGYLYGRRPGLFGHLRLGWPFWLLAPAAALVGWLNIVGGLQLRPPRSWLLFDLPRLAQLSSGGGGPHPLGSQAGAECSGFVRLVVPGTDPLAASLTLAGGCQILAVLALLLLFCRYSEKAPLAMAMGGLAWLMGSADGWLLDDLPAEAVAHLLVVLALALAWSRGALWALGPLAGLALLNPPQAAGMLLAFFVRPPRRLPLLLLLVGLSLGRGGGGVGLLAASYLWWFHPNSRLRQLALLEFFCPGGFGLAALGLAAGRALTARWRRYGRDRWGLGLRPAFYLRLPRRLLVGTLALVGLWLAMAQGEEAFNDGTLIFSQKEKVRLEGLLPPRTLEEWVAWRGEALGLTAADRAAAERLRTLSEPTLYLTGTWEEPARVTALVSALAGGQPLAGWYLGSDGEALLPAAAAVSAGGSPELLRSTPVRWLLRRGSEPLAIAPQPAVSAARNGGGEAVRIERWGRLVWYTTRSAASYQVLRDGRPFGEEFAVSSLEPTKMPFVLPSGLPGRYTVRWADGREQSYDSARPLPLEATLLADESLPSRSLLPLKLRLVNRAAAPLRLDDLEKGRLRLVSLTGKVERPFPEFALALRTIEPGKAVERTVYLRTPVAPDIFRLELQLLDAQGEAHVLPLPGPIRTWNRRPSLVVPEGVTRR